MIETRRRSILKEWQRYGSHLFSLLMGVVLMLLHRRIFGDHTTDSDDDMANEDDELEDDSNNDAPEDIEAQLREAAAKEREQEQADQERRELEARRLVEEAQHAHAALRRTTNTSSSGSARRSGA